MVVFATILVLCYYIKYVHRYATEVPKGKERNFTHLVKEQPYENRFRTLSKK